MTKGIYTPGQVSGLTGIPVRSIRRIVAKYPEAFSPGASAPRVRRHRFTPDDIAKLKLYREHNHSVYSFRDLLLGCDPEGLPKTGIESLTVTIRKLIKENKELHQRFDHHFANHYKLSLSGLNDQVVLLRQELQDLREQYQADLATTKSDLAGQLMVANKKRSFFG